jgi:uncharacterized membrane protein (DUF2068 family)
MAGYDTVRGGDPEVTVRAVDSGTYDAEKGVGWVLYAGIMLMLLGILNFIFGVAAVSNSKFYIQDAQYILSSLNTYGWILLVIGVIQFCVAFAIWAGTEWGRWLGVLAAGLNSIAQLLFIPAHPFIALAMFSLDILVIYGLVAYGGHQIRSAR